MGPLGHSLYTTDGEASTIPLWKGSELENMFTHLFFHQTCNRHSPTCWEADTGLPGLQEFIMQ